MNVNWVACGTCYTQIEGTELGGIELQRSSYFFKWGSFRPFEVSPRRIASRDPLTHMLSFGNKFSSKMTKHALE